MARIGICVELVILSQKWTPTKNTMEFNVLLNKEGLPYASIVKEIISDPFESTINLFKQTCKLHESFVDIRFVDHKIKSFVSYQYLTIVYGCEIPYNSEFIKDKSFQYYNIYDPAIEKISPEIYPLLTKTLTKIGHI